MQYLKLEPYCRPLMWTNLMGSQDERKEDQDPEVLLRLGQLLNRVCIRHRSQDIKSEHELPECEVKVIRLDMGAQEREKYNARVASVRANLILTEGEGPDSYLHKQNKKYAWQTINNLLETCTHLSPLEIPLCNSSVKVMR